MPSNLNRYGERKQVIDWVFRVVKLNRIVGIGDCIVVGLNENRLNLINGYTHHLFDEIRLSGCIDINFINFRFLDRWDIVLFVNAIAGNIVSAEVAVRNLDNLLFADLLHACDFTDRPIPILKREESVSHQRRSCEIRFQSRFLRFLEVGHDCRHQPILKFSPLNQFKLFDKELFDLRKGLSLLGDAPEVLRAVIVVQIRIGACAPDFLLLIQIQVNEPRGRIVQNHIQQYECLHILMIASFGAERQQNILFALILHRHAFNTLQRGFLPCLKFRKFLGLPFREMGVDELDGFLNVDVTGDVNRHIVRHIVGVVKFVHLLQ